MSLVAPRAQANRPHPQGGFSYVYLVQDTASPSDEYALKKIRCPFGAESVAQAMREVEAYRMFAHTPGIIHSVDHAVATERGGGGTSGIGGNDENAKKVYVLLPYYRRGNLQDMINANLVNHARFPERRLLLLFLGICRALKAMHQYRGPPAGMARMEMEVDEDEAPARGARKKGKKRAKNVAAADDEDEGEQQRGLLEGGGPGGSETRSYAHRDIKPGQFFGSHLSCHDHPLLASYRDL